MAATRLINPARKQGENYLSGQQENKLDGKTKHQCHPVYSKVFPCKNGDSGRNCGKDAAETVMMKAGKSKGVRK